MKPIRICLAVALAITGVLAMAPSAEAAHHLVKIRQVYPGTAGDGNEPNEFVVLQLTGLNENMFGNSVTVKLYGENGVETNTVTSSVNPPNGANQATVLAATTAAAGAFTVTPDLTFMNNTDTLSPDGGAACLISSSFGPLDCVGWGNLTFASPPSPIGPLEAAIPEMNMLERSIIAGCPTLHDFGDDTNNSANDFFATGQPGVPRNNAAPITETICRVLTVTRPGTGTGTVTGTGINCPGDCSELIPNNTPVTLTATPTGGSTFAGFSANCTPGPPGECTVPMSMNQTVAATFDTSSTPPPNGGGGTTQPTTPALPKKKCKKGQKLKKGKCVKKKRKKK